MVHLHTVLFCAHILFGSMALILFWIPVLSRKGSLDHKRFGRYYGNVMYGVAGTGAAMAILVLLLPLTIKGHLLSQPEHQAEFVTNIRIFWAFLLYLSLLTFVSVRQGFHVLIASNSELRTVRHLFPIGLLLLCALVLIVSGVYLGKTLYMVFGALGTAISTGMLRYCIKGPASHGHKVTEHLGAMIGSGIGAYTAFLAFGGRTLFSGAGEWQLVFWILPGVVGSIAIGRMARKYKQAGA